MKNIRTRFAPSPTGELHIGGVRTALFNYLFARKNEGQFVLRTEDTDTARNQEKFVKNQYEDLGWLGLKPDESIFQSGEFEPYRQSQRLDIYQKYIDQLLQEKKAYCCFCLPAELELERKKYIQENKRSNYQYSRKCLQLKDKEISFLLKKKTPYVIRLKIPNQKNYFFQDLVRGEINFQGKDIEDFILFRQNGIPNYNFVCVIDDYLMQISHVLRGEEHLSNTGKQLVLYEAFGWNPPQFGHLSIILNKTKQKLSKRDPETSQWQLIKQLREKGYLPQSIINYLLLLGWNPKTRQEIFSLSEAIKAFNLTGLRASGAIYDLDKLNWFNNYYIQQLSEGEFVEYAWQFLTKNYNLEKQKKKEWVKQISLLFRPQLNCFFELIGLSDYFFTEPVEFIFEIPLPLLEKLAIVKKALLNLSHWNEENIQQIIYSDKKLLPWLRLKLTGKNKGPELPKIIYLLDKELVLKRFV